MKFWTYIALFFVAPLLLGQSLSIQPQKESILIGERNLLTIKLNATLNSEDLVEFSELPAVKMTNLKNKDSVGVEVLAVELDSEELRLFVTAWDSGLLIIPPFVIDKMGALMTEATMFRVDFPSVDENGEILDIRESNFDIPLFQNFNQKNWWLIDLIILILFLLGLWIVLKIKDAIPEVVVPEVVLPIEEIAVEELKKLYAKKLFGKEDQKLHFVAFSDILRKYIAERFKVITFEKTTSELLDALRVKSVPKNQLDWVEELLSTADMIKFSKAYTNEVEMNRLHEIALNFIQISTEWHKNHNQIKKGEQADA
jgi:hypothetical protein